MSKQTTLFSVSNITKTYNKKIILDSVSFELKKQEILSILGFSGEGKTTLLNILCGVEVQDSGEIHFKEREIKNIIGYSPQNHSFIEELSVEDNLLYFASLYKLSKQDSMDKKQELLKKFNLEHVTSQRPGELSEGQKKRVDISCALIHSPKILILDEPTANLDFYLRDELLDYIKKINKDGVSVIFVSHILEDIEKISQRNILLNKTKLVDFPHTKNLQKNIEEVIQK